VDPCRFVGVEDTEQIRTEQLRRFHSRREMVRGEVQDGIGAGDGVSYSCKTFVIADDGSHPGYVALASVEDRHFVRELVATIVRELTHQPPSHGSQSASDDDFHD